MDIPEDYVRWFFENNKWKSVSYRGLRTLKFPMDMWNYQEIIHAHGIEWIVETGTRHGGSAVFFADQLSVMERAGKVFTIDISPELQGTIDSHQKIQNFIGDSADPVFVDRIYAQIPKPRGPLFLILDSDHRADHVYRELVAHIPHLISGDYVIVEDTILNSELARPEFGPGPKEALEKYLNQNPGQLAYDQVRDEKYGPGFAWRGFFTIV